MLMATRVLRADIDLHRNGQANSSYEGKLLCAFNRFLCAIET